MRLLVALVVAALCAATLLVPPAPARAAGDAPACSTAGTWVPGELNVYWFDVEQGDSQLVVGPTGRTLLVDLGERSWNAQSNTMSHRVAAAIRAICGISSGPVHLDYVMASHLHLDHIGYAGNPGDDTNLGNGIYRLLHPGGEAFTVGTLVDRDGGSWQDTDGNGTCGVGTSAAPSDEIAWHNAGTVSQTSRRWLCWVHGPAGQADRAHIEGRVLVLANDTAWPSLDLGAGVAAPILGANGKDVLQADGVTPVSGDHTAAATPPSENDYSIAVRLAFGDFAYATAGDSDGRYGTSGFGYTYNDVEALLIDRFGNVDTLRVNHHGSGNSSSQAYIDGLRPETAVISCGANSYGHPANRVLDALRGVVHDTGVGADIYLTNNPCDTTDSDGGAIDYSGTLGTDGNIWLHTTGGGTGYSVNYAGGFRTYQAVGDDGSGGGSGPAGTPADVVINEYLMAPRDAHTTEWVELHNPTAADIAVGGLYIDDLAGGGGAPRQIPDGTVIPAGGHWVADFASGLLNNTGYEEVRFLAVEGGVETVYDLHSYELGSTRYDQSFHRAGDAGEWCAALTSSPTKGTANPAACG